ncbi:MAG: PHP domain-containing protein [Verrucomicrobia bacterium]|nr:PHP domain-containing protein [Verrucomicrobiota bacterium]MBM3869968.1 PHP domain-containing protein [Verrucomicrobiota bacterium]
MFADLHMHTTFSDGTFSPEEMAQAAQRHRLACVALTDHDTIAGCARMAAECARLGIEFVNATELTAEMDGVEVHILGYFIDLADAHFLANLVKFQHARQQRIRDMAARLQAQGIPLQAEAVFAIARCESPGRPHVARALVQAGLCSSMDEAFERFLKKHRPAWVPKFKISAYDAIELIHRAGGVAVIAHPALNKSDEIIPALVEAGIDGIECFHTRHSTAASEHYMLLAEHYGLAISGGSDCHGMNKGRPLMGGIKLPIIQVRQLEARARAIREKSLLAA